MKKTAGKKRRRRWSAKDPWNDEEPENEAEKKVEKGGGRKQRKKRRTKVDIVHDHLLAKRVMCKKENICNDLKMHKSGVDRACQILRKQKKIVMHRKKYWGIIVPLER